MYKQVFVCTDFPAESQTSRTTPGHSESSEETRKGTSATRLGQSYVSLCGIQGSHGLAQHRCIIIDVRICLKCDVLKLNESVKP